MSLQRREAPKKYLPVSRSNTVFGLGYADAATNADIVEFQVLPAGTFLPARLVAQGADGNANSAGFVGLEIIPDSTVAPTNEVQVCIRNLSHDLGFATRAFTTGTIGSGFWFGDSVLQVGTYADQGGVTITLTLPTTAEVIAKLCGRNRQLATLRVIQAATNAADQIDFINSDLAAIRFNGGGQTGTTQYDIHFDIDAANAVRATILNV